MILSGLEKYPLLLKLLGNYEFLINFSVFVFLFYTFKKVFPAEFMINDNSHQISLLLNDWSQGEPKAFERLMPLVYKELHQMARRYMRQQPAGHTFQTTELIHEAYLKIANQDERNWQSRAHFFGVAAQVMRHILVDYARSKSRKKRGGWQDRVSFSEEMNISTESSDEMVALDEALNQLTELDARKSRVVELKFFGGLTTEEVAEVLKISPETVKRDWRFSRNWLLRELTNKA